MWIRSLVAINQFPNTSSFYICVTFLCKAQRTTSIKPTNPISSWNWAPRVWLEKPLWKVYRRWFWWQGLQWLEWLENAFLWMWHLCWDLNNEKNIAVCRFGEKNIPERGNNRYKVPKTGSSLAYSKGKKGPVYQTAIAMIMLCNRVSPNPTYVLLVLLTGVQIKWGYFIF